MHAGIALAHLYAGRYDEAAIYAEKANREIQGFVFATSILAASHALAGRLDRARQEIQHLRQFHPSLPLSNLRDWLPIARTEDHATLSEGLRRAGLPD